MAKDLSGAARAGLIASTRDEAFAVEPTFESEDHPLVLCAALEGLYPRWQPSIYSRPLLASAQFVQPPAWLRGAISEGLGFSHCGYIFRRRSSRLVLISCYPTFSAASSAVRARYMQPVSWSAGFPGVVSSFPHSQNAHGKSIVGSHRRASRRARAAASILRSLSDISSQQMPHDLCSIKCGFPGTGKKPVTNPWGQVQWPSLSGFSVM